MSKVCLLLIFLMIGGIRGSPYGTYSEEQRTRDVTQGSIKYDSTLQTRVDIDDSDWKIVFPDSLDQQYKKRYPTEIGVNPEMRVEKDNSDGKISYPDSLDTQYKKPYLTEFSVNLGNVPKCPGKTFCERVDNYPVDFINKAMKNTNSTLLLVIEDGVVDVQEKMNDEVPVCGFREQVVFPPSAEGKDGKWHFIVNHDNFKQGVKVEICENENGKCDIENQAEGYEYLCKQKFSYRQLASVSTDGTIERQLFRFPSSCGCYMRFLVDPLYTMGYR